MKFFIYGKTKEEMELSIKKYTKYIILSDEIPVGVISFDKKKTDSIILAVYVLYRHIKEKE